MHGNGKYTYANGDIYIGQWVDDKRQGFGTLNHANGDCYEGDFFEDECHGVGKLTKPDGSYYEGPWKSGNEHGIGIYVKPYQGVYVGNYGSGARQGNGVYVCTRLAVHEQRYTDGTKSYSNVLHSVSLPQGVDIETLILRFPAEDDRLVFIGENENGIPLGFGVTVMRNGRVCIGKFTGRRLVGEAKNLQL